MDDSVYISSQPTGSAVASQAQPAVVGPLTRLIKARAALDLTHGPGFSDEEIDKLSSAETSAMRKVASWRAKSASDAIIKLKLAFPPEQGPPGESNFADHRLRISALRDAIAVLTEMTTTA